jgi:hypothetical protein
VESVHGRLHPKEMPGPARVDFGVVKRIASSVEISISKRDLPINLFEEWARDLIISKIPGASDESV